MKDTCAWRAAVLAGALGFLFAGGAQAAGLYGAEGSGVLSDLYVIDPTTGAGTSIGPIGFSLTGLVFDPTTGILFGTTASNDVSADNLITIDLATGAGTIVGPGGLGDDSIADLAIGPDGTLYGWQENSIDDLVTIDKATGAATVVGNSALSTYGNGMAFDAAGTLYGAPLGDSEPLYTIDPVTGAATPGPTLDGVSDLGIAAADFHPQTDVLYAARKTGFFGAAAELVTIDTATGEITVVGASLNALDALAFAPLCGDSVVDAPTETCDDGNTVGNDGCDMNCQLECGNGLPNPGEVCDDGNLVDGDGCSADCQALTFCLPAPDPACIDAEKGSLSIQENKPGNEKLKASIKGLSDSTDLGDFGDPVGGTTVYELCVFDQAGVRVANLRVPRAGDTCGAKAKPCWKNKGSSGYAYKDPDAESAGVQKIATKAGAEGKGKLTVQAGNKAKKGQDDLPTGIAAALAGDSSATVEVQTSNAGCFAADLTEVKKSDTTQFKAK